MYNEGTTFRFRKTNQHGQPLAGAEFVLVDSVRRKTHTAISDRNGEVIFRSLERGIYTLEEVVAPIGYALSEDIFIVDVRDPHDIYVNGARSETFRFPANTPKGSTNDLVFLKVNEAFMPIQGATFGLRDVNNIERYRATSGHNGVVKFENIAPGIYTLYEKTVPGGYIPSQINYRVTVNNTGQILVNNVPSYFFRYVINRRQRLY